LKRENKMEEKTHPSSRSILRDKQTMHQEDTMERRFEVENARERERLRSLVNGMTDEELALKIYDEGWTIAVALAHLAFGDQRTLALLRRWKKSGVARETPLDIDPINDALLPLFLAIPPRTAANLAVWSADTLDRTLEEADPELTNAIESLAPNRLYRATHRKRHLDEIEALLQAKH
jgi:hypothetical protein